jgi:sugar (pentulose or hexulose) kinase
MFLGIELGSTRVKSVLINAAHEPVASGAVDWENRLQDGVWTYPLSEAERCVSEAVDKLLAGRALRPEALGVSAMMHGYLAFDKHDNLLVPFRTWRNAITQRAAGELSELFGFNIPQRWSVAHLYQAILNGEPHVKDIAYMTTLAGYIHYRLTGERVLGAGDASGMFPLDGLQYHAGMRLAFERLTGIDIADIFPRVLPAGAPAGRLTEEGARLLSPSGLLEPGVLCCPPEGDAGTGMTATCSVAERTGNISAGTSVFAMLVLDKPLSRHYPEIGVVSTPHGKPAAMTHANTCTSDIDAWVRLFAEVSSLMGARFDTSELYDKLYHAALEGGGGAEGLLNYNFFAAEPVAGLPAGCPLFCRRPGAPFTLPGFMRAQLYSAMAVLRIGLDILTTREGVCVSRFLAHGGLFKTKGPAQRLLAGALGVPVAVMPSAGEGGAWGAALLAAFAARGGGDSLENYLSQRVFYAAGAETVQPSPCDAADFGAFFAVYKKGLPLAGAAAQIMLGGTANE